MSAHLSSNRSSGLDVSQYRMRCGFNADSFNCPKSVAETIRFGILHVHDSPVFWRPRMVAALGGGSRRRLLGFDRHGPLGLTRAHGEVGEERRLWYRAARPTALGLAPRPVRGRAGRLAESDALMRASHHRRICDEARLQRHAPLPGEVCRVAGTAAHLDGRCTWRPLDQWRSDDRRRHREQAPWRPRQIRRSARRRGASSPGRPAIRRSPCDRDRRRFQQVAGAASAHPRDGRAERRATAWMPVAIPHRASVDRDGARCSMTPGARSGDRKPGGHLAGGLRRQSRAPGSA